MYLSYLEKEYGAANLSTCFGERNDTTLKEKISVEINGERNQASHHDQDVIKRLLLPLHFITKTMTTNLCVK